MRRIFATLLLAALVTSCSLGDNQTNEPTSNEQAATDDTADRQAGDVPDQVDSTDDGQARDTTDEVNGTDDGQAGDVPDQVDDPPTYDVCDLVDPAEVLVAASDELGGASTSADDLELRPTVFPGIPTSPACEANLRSLNGSVTWGVRDPEVTASPDPDEVGDQLVESLTQADDDPQLVEEEIDLDGVVARLITSQQRRYADEEDREYFVWLRFSHAGLDVQVDGRDFADSPDGRDAATTAEVARDTTVEIARLLVAAINDAENARPERIALDATCPDDEEALADLLDGEVAVARSYERQFSIVCFYATETTFARLASEYSEDGELNGELTESPFEEDNRELDGRLMVAAPSDEGAQAEVMEGTTCRLRASYDPPGVWDTGYRYPSDLDEPGDEDFEAQDAFFEHRVQRVIGLMELLYDQAWDSRSCPS